MVIGMKKFIKDNPIKDNVYRIPPQLVGGVFLYGKIGACKTATMLSLSQKYRDVQGYKIFDMYGGDRNEGPYWALPSRDYEYWKRVKKTLTIKEDGPKQYKVRLLYPYFQRKLPSKLPSNLPHVQSKIFTIPIKEINIQDIAHVIGHVPETAVSQWRELIEITTKTDGPASIDFKFQKVGSKKSILYKNFLLPLIRENFIQNANNSHNLDIVAEVKDRETISILCLDYVDEEFKLFVIEWIMRQIGELLDKGQLPKKNIFLLREVSKFFRADDTAIVPERYKIFKRFLTDMIRYGRRGMHLFCESQSPSETKNICDGSQDLTIFGKMPSDKDKKAGTDELAKSGLIDPKQIKRISRLEPGQVIIAESGKHAIDRYMLLPRTMYWEPKYSNFYKVWEAYTDNKWTNLKDIKNELKECFLAEQKSINEKLKLEKTLKMKEQVAQVSKLKPVIEIIPNLVSKETNPAEERSAWELQLQ